MRALAALRLRPELEDMGNGSDPTAWFCRLIDSDGIVPPNAEGSGKGSREEARVGALFEALEHVLTGPAYFAPGQVRLRPAGRVVAGALADEASCTVLAQAPEEKLACWLYTELRGGRELDVPLYLSAPWYVQGSGGELRKRVGDQYDYRGVARYSMNSGSAIGVTESEAVVHALNEVIERDAFSRLLIRSFLIEGHIPTRIDPQTLPCDLSELFGRVQQRVGATVHLLDITTELDVPTIFAYVAPTVDRPHLRGAGTSLSSHYAAYRALTELLQGFLGKEHQPSFGPPFGYLEPLRRYPPLYACGRFDLTALLEQATSTAFTQRLAPNDLEAHLDKLIAALAEHGFTPYQRHVHTMPGGIIAVHILVPGLERFMIITQGCLVLPGRRGRHSPDPSAHQC